MWYIIKTFALLFFAVLIVLGSCTDKSYFIEKNLDKFKSVSESIIEKGFISETDQSEDLANWYLKLPDNTEQLDYLAKYLSLTEIDVSEDYGIFFQGSEKNIFGDRVEHNILFTLNKNDLQELIYYEQYSECRAELKVFDDHWAYSRQIIPCSD